jgi:hypothetical protein
MTPCACSSAKESRCCFRPTRPAAGSRRTAAAFPSRRAPSPWRSCGSFPKPWPVIVPSGSCAGTMRHHYPEMFADDPRLQAEANALAERVFELSEFLVHVARVSLA